MKKPLCKMSRPSWERSPSGFAGISSSNAATDDDATVFETLRVRKERAVLFAEIAARPMNLLGPELVRDMVTKSRELILRIVLSENTVWHSFDIRAGEACAQGNRGACDLKDLTCPQKRL
jgi:hypothetical protein